jgi:hypothetical protein
MTANVAKADEHVRTAKKYISNKSAWSSGWQTRVRIPMTPSAS